MTKEIVLLEDIKMLVDTFYGKVREDEMLAPIFNPILQDRWPEHMEKMYTFWQTILLSERTYNGSPFPPHAQLPISEAHFERWLSLFYQTIDDKFEGNKADEAKWRASRIAEVFQSRLDMYRDANPFLI